MIALVVVCDDFTGKAMSSLKLLDVLGTCV